jgi:hypothetical protein
MWPGRPMVVSNMIVFHNDIGAFVSVFGWFPAKEPVNSLHIFLNKMRQCCPFCSKNKSKLQLDVDFSHRTSWAVG